MQGQTMLSKQKCKVDEALQSYRYVTQGQQGKTGLMQFNKLNPAYK